MTRWFAVLGVFLGSLCVALAYASAFLPGGTPTFGPWLMVIGLDLMIFSTMVLGIAREGSGVGRLAWPLAICATVILASFAVAMLLPANEGAGAALVFGLPARAAAVLYGVGLLPLFVLPIAYAVTFDTVVLTEADVERVRLAGVAYRAKLGAGDAR